MFLDTLRSTARRSDGAALVTVVAVMAITAIVGVTITASVITATGFSNSTRADVQARAAADAGVDAAFAAIAGGTYVCAAPIVSGGPSYAATVAYQDAGGVALPCSGATVVGAPSTATITSVGQATNRATQGTAGNNHTVVATVTITPGSGSGNLDKAVFSESGFTLTNNNQLIESSNDANDANIYSNGTIICKTQVDVEGILYSQGNVSLENTCTTYSDVWAKGNITFSSQAVVNGHVFAAGTGQLDLSTGHVAGSIITNGSVTMSNNSGVLACPSAAAKAVCGSVVALGGSIYAGNGASIGGSAFAKTSVTLNNMNGVTGVGTNVIAVSDGFANDSNSNQAGRVGGSVRVGTTIGGYTGAMTDKANSCQKVAGNGFAACVGALSIPAPTPSIVVPSTLGYPTTGVVNPPPREEMPQINSAASDLSKWVADGWTVTTFNASTAASSGKSSCQQAKDFVAVPRAGKNLVVVRDCATPVTWDNTTLTISGDIAMMSTSGFKTDNIFKVQSNDTTMRGFMFIVPADSSYITWSAVAGTNPTQYSPTCGTRPQDVGDIRINNTTMTNVAWLAYTPCYLGFQNQLDGFRGQLYGGSVNYPNNSTIQLVKFSVPGVTSSSSAPSGGVGTAVITSRSDVNAAG